GHAGAAERIVDGIERDIGHRSTTQAVDEVLTLRPRRFFGLAFTARVMFHQYRSRSLLCAVLMMAQAFLYNAIFFTYAMVLMEFYAVPAADTALYLLPFALGNFLGPIVLGPAFDTVGRRTMIALTYGIAAML